MKKNNLLLNPLIILFFINLIFFLPLFFPNLKLIITPEYGGGDENLFHYPIKYLFQQKLRLSKLLIWSDDMGGGYPVFALGEIGLLNPINVLTLFFLPFSLAINMQIFLSFLILLFSTYWLGRSLKFEKLPSIYLSSIFAFSFFIISNIIHLSHLSSFIYIPLILALTVEIIDSKKIKLIYLLLMIVAFCFQIISGHIQYVFYTFIFIYSYLLLAYFFNKVERKLIFVKIILISVVIIFALGLSSFQLLPTYQYYHYSNRKLINSQIISPGLNLKNLITFIYPFISYNIDLKKIGDSTRFVPPWDSNFYFGFLPFGLLLLLLIPNKLINKNEFIKKNRIWIILFIVYLLLSFGQNSPLYLINVSLPFSMFRVPERISFLVVFVLTILSAYIFNKLYLLRKKRINMILIVIVVTNFLINMVFMYKFHLLLSGKDFFKKNTLINYLEKEKNERFISLYFYEETIPLDLYNNGIVRVNFKNFNLIKIGLPQNMNLFYDLKSFNLPTSAFNLNRHFYFYTLLFSKEESFYDRVKTETASLSNSAKNLLEITKIKYIISPYQLLDPSSSIKLVKKIAENSADKIVFLYETNSQGERLDFYTKTKKIGTLKQFEKNLEEDNQENTVYVESDYNNKDLDGNINSEFKIDLLSEDALYVKAKVTTLTDGVLVLADNYFPGWRAYINGEETKIFRANFLFRGIYLPKGNHTVEFKYLPDSFYLGTQISLMTLISLIILIIFIKVYPKKFPLFA